MIQVDPALDAVSAVLTERGVGWAVAGGWAIDLFVGRVTRPHADIDLMVWRDEQMKLRRSLAGWEFSVALSGRLRPWATDEAIEPPLHELHARDPNSEKTVEFLLNDRERGLWIYRRDPSIRLPITGAIQHNG